MASCKRARTAALAAPRTACKSSTQFDDGESQLLHPEADVRAGRLRSHEARPDQSAWERKEGRSAVPPPAHAGSRSPTPGRCAAADPSPCRPLDRKSVV